MVYVLNIHGDPLMPCKEAKARKLLKSNKAKIANQRVHSSVNYKKLELLKTKKYYLIERRKQGGVA